MTSDEAAALLGIDRRTLYTNARDREKTGFPEPKRFGRALAWPRDELLEWRAKHPARRRRKVDVNPEPDEGQPAGDA